MSLVKIIPCVYSVPLRNFGRPYPFDDSGERGIPPNDVVSSYYYLCNTDFLLSLKTFF